MTRLDDLLLHGAGQVVLFEHVEHALLELALGRPVTTLVFMHQRLEARDAARSCVTGQVLGELLERRPPSAQGFIETGSERRAVFSCRQVEQGAFDARDAEARDHGDLA